MNIFITGFTGFSGSFLVQFLLERGHCLYISCRQSLKKPNMYRHPRLHLIQGDLNTLKILPQHLDAVIHVAATSPTINTKTHDYLHDNIMATEKLVTLASMASVKKFIFFSSLSVYGDIKDSVVNEQTPILNPNAYGMSKLYGEFFLKEKAMEMSSIALRLPAVIGGGASRHWLATMLMKALRGDPITIFNPDAAFNNAVHIQDLCLFVEHLLTCSFTGFVPLTLGANSCLPIGFVIEKMKIILGSSSKIFIDTEKRYSFTISSEKAKKEFNYKPRSIDAMLEHYFIEKKDLCAPV